MRELSGIDPALTSLTERLEAAQYELEDVAQEVRRYRDAVESDPQRLDAIETRLDLLLRLRRKYGATIEEVIAFGQRARTEMEEAENLDERIEALEGDLARVEERAGGLAAELSAARSRAAASLTAAMREALQGLGLKGTDLVVEVAQTGSDTGLALPDGRRVASSQTGVDSIAFLVSFNPGEQLRPLEKAASGGETSRFLLAVKSVLAEADRIPTLVFDEVDVGVGGRAATVVGERLRHLSRSHQVLSITHLPQVAALADQHDRVVKVAAVGRTSVDVQSLDRADRVLELAEMMSGAGTEAARRSAEELLEAARRSA
jgi:DNA repair protein RecN (Recombination protein N)